MLEKVLCSSYFSRTFPDRLPVFVVLPVWARTLYIHSSSNRFDKPDDGLSCVCTLSSLERIDTYVMANSFLPRLMLVSGLRVVDSRPLPLVHSGPVAPRLISIHLNVYQSLVITRNIVDPPSTLHQTNIFHCHPVVVRRLCLVLVALVVVVVVVGYDMPAPPSVRPSVAVRAVDILWAVGLARLIQLSGGGGRNDLRCIMWNLFYIKYIVCLFNYMRKHIKTIIHINRGYGGGCTAQPPERLRTPF